MLKAESFKYILKFKCPGGTSRGVLTQKESWFIRVWEEENPSVVGIGECGLLKGLSVDDRPGFVDKLRNVCANIHQFEDLKIGDLSQWPSISFGVEMALLDLKSEGKRTFFPSAFTMGEQAIPINGLIWMGSPDSMRQQIREKLDLGFNCIKLKIGAINFEEEIKILKEIRKEYGRETLEVRVDANGAFSPKEAISRLWQLEPLHLHSIEQPIMANQWEEMASLCENTPIPIALDEELIGVDGAERKNALLDIINPHFIVLKPTLVGGFQSSGEWISLAQKRDISWWITSALESNIGLNAIAQWTYTLNNTIPQGLGTGQLFTNNIPSPLEVKGGFLHYCSDIEWEVETLNYREI